MFAGKLEISEGTFYFLFKLNFYKVKGLT
jgi:hypothetical protein